MFFGLRARSTLLAALVLLALPGVEARGAAARITIQPVRPVVSVGATVGLSATVRDQAGMPLPSSAVTWRTASPRVLLTPDGLLTGVSEGEFSVTAVSGGVTATVDGRVVPLAADALVEAADLSLPSGAEASLLLTYRAARPLRRSELRVTLVPQAAPGSVPLVLGTPAASPGVKVQVVERSGDALRLRLNAAEGLTGSGTLMSLPLRAPVTDRDLRYQVRLEEAGLQSPDPPALCLVDGSVRVQAASSGPAAAVVPAPSSLELRVGDAYALDAAVLDAEGSAVPGASVAWRVASGEEVAQVEASGRVVALSPGQAIVAADASGLTGEVHLDVVGSDQEAADTPHLILPFLAARPGATVSLPLLATGARSLAGLRLDVRILPSAPAGAPALAIGTPQAGPAALGAAVAANTSRPGSLALGLLSERPLSEDGVLLWVPVTLPLDAPGGATYPLSVTLVDVSDTEANLLPVVAQSGGIIVPPDTEPPTVRFVNLKPGALLGGVVTLEAQATDNYAVRSLELLVDGFPTSVEVLPSGALRWDSSALEDGAHTFRLRATDTSGNSAQSDSVAVSLDNAPPVVELSSPGEGSALSLPLEVRGTVTDLNLAGYELAVLKPGSLTYETVASGASERIGEVLGVYSGGGLPQGVYRFRLSASDRAGNSAETEVAGILDTVAPSLRFLAPQTDSAVRETFSVQIEARDATGVVGVEVYLDDLAGPVASLKSAPYRWTLNPAGLPDGLHYLRAVAMDPLGNIGEARVRWILDRAAPVIHLLGDPGRRLVGGSSRLAVDLQDLSPLEYQVEFGRGAVPTQWTPTGPFRPVQSGQVELPVGSLPVQEGLGSLRVTVVDAAGNAAELLVPVEVDGVPPTAQIAFPGDGDLSSVDLEVLGSASDPAMGASGFGRYALEAAPEGAPDGWQTVAFGEDSVVNGLLGRWEAGTLPPGAYELRLTVWDQAGNQSVSSRRVTLHPAVPGDLNGDRVLSVADVLVALRIVVGMRPQTPGLMPAGDLAPQRNPSGGVGDGVINIMDVVVLLKRILGL